MQGTAVELAAVNGTAESDAGVAHGTRLVAFVDAVMSGDEVALEQARRALRRGLTPSAFVDVCAVVGMFNVVDRVADATGIPLDEPLVIMSVEVRDELDLARFPSSVNSRRVLGP
jgi:hypothetical protein